MDAVENDLGTLVPRIFEVVVEGADLCKRDDTLLVESVHRIGKSDTYRVIVMRIGKYKRGEGITVLPAAE